MYKIILSCPSFNPRIDVNYGLDSIRNYALMQDDLKEKIDIDIMPLFTGQSLDTPLQYITGKNPDVIGISTFIWTVHDNIVLAQEIKKRLPDTIIVVGGPQVSDTGWDILQECNAIDIVIRGEGEITFCELLRELLKNKQFQNPDISGISYRNSFGETIHNPDRTPIKDMDIIPFRYRDFVAEPDVLYGLETARGCYNKCGYCSLGYMDFRIHSIEYILDELDNMAQAGIKLVNILDSSFTFNKNRMIRISEKMKVHGMRYVCCANAEELDDEIIDILLKTGVKKIEFGLQTINTETLKTMNRSLDRKKYKRNIDLFMEQAKSTDVEVTIDIICGLPGDNLETFCESLNFAYELRPHFIAAFPLLLLPGTYYFKNRKSLKFEYIDYMYQLNEIKGRYNMHKFGLVLENLTFSKEEIEKGRLICLLNGLIIQTHLNHMIYNLLDQTGLTFSILYDKINVMLPDNFYSCLEACDTEATKKAVWNNLCKAFEGFAVADYPDLLENISQKLKRIS